MFYLRPAAKGPADPTAPWYERALVCKEKLRTFVATMCQEAGIAPKTNHSLRATGAAALFNANVPEKMIRDVTRHHSNLLQLYEHPTLQQKQAVSSVLVQGKPTMEAGKENHHPVPICHALQQKQAVSSILVQGKPNNGGRERESPSSTNMPCFAAAAGCIKCPGAR